jgi:uncharacterized protein (DUF2132 family)
MTQPTIPLPQIDYEGAIAHGWGTLKIRQGSLACIAFARGAEWARDTMMADYAAACVQAERERQRNEIEQLRAAAEQARKALSELILTRDPIVYSDALRALDEALGPNG